MKNWVRNRFIATVTAALAAVPFGCGATMEPCGEFSITGLDNGNRGVGVTVGFDFDPAVCSVTCISNSNAYVQIVRIIDLDTGIFMAPNSEQRDRIVTGRPQVALDGWAVDRIAGRQWGHYGRNDDGTFASSVTTGSNTTRAVLRDSTSVSPENASFDAVTVPVSIDTASTCTNRLLGYQYWQFAYTNGTITGPSDALGIDWHRDAFDQAVIEWNASASLLGKNGFEVMTRLEP